MSEQPRRRRRRQITNEGDETKSELCAENSAAITTETSESPANTLDTSDSIAAENTKQPNPIKISDVKCGYYYSTSPTVGSWKPYNYAGGVDFHVEFKNISTKTIKYIVFVVEPKNAVNDIVKCSMTGKSVTRLQMTGPIYSGQGKYPTWSSVWYNTDIKTVSIQSIEIEYMDGTKQLVMAEELNKASGDSSEDYTAVIIAIVGIVLFVLLMMSFVDSDNSSSSYSSYSKSKTSSSSSNYDRHYSNDEIKDFINSYNGKW